MPAGYSTRALVDKLGLKTGMSALLINATESLKAEIPQDVKAKFVKTIPSVRSKQFDYIHYFTTQEASLAQNLGALKAQLEQNGMIWISWPKKAAKKIANIDTDLTEGLIRDHALAIGLVDVKVCAIDEIWSGLKLVIPVKDRQK
jgi:hypothetical protein